MQVFHPCLEALGPCVAPGSMLCSELAASSASSLEVALAVFVFKCWESQPAGNKVCLESVNTLGGCLGPWPQQALEQHHWQCNSVKQSQLLTDGSLEATAAEVPPPSSPNTSLGVLPAGLNGAVIGENVAERFHVLHFAPTISGELYGIGSTAAESKLRKETCVRQIV